MAIAKLLKVKIPGLGKKYKAEGTVLANFLKLDASIGSIGSIVTAAFSGSDVNTVVVQDALKEKTALALEQAYVFTRQFMDKSAQDVVTAHGKFLVSDKGAAFFAPPEPKPVDPNAPKKANPFAAAKAAKELAAKNAAAQDAAPKA